MCDYRANGNRLTWGDHDLAYRRIPGALDIDDGLIGLDLAKEISGTNLIAGLDIPSNDGALCHRRPELRQTQSDLHLNCPS